MKKWILFLCLFPTYLWSQTSPLTVEKIMQDPQWIGSSPSQVFWSPNSEKIYFAWNPEQAETESLYVYKRGKTPQKLSLEEASLAKAIQRGAWNKAHTQKVFQHQHSLKVLDVRSGKIQTLRTAGKSLRQLQFGLNDRAIVYRQGNNLYALYLSNGKLEQLTNFKTGKASQKKELTAQEEFLKQDALKNSQVLSERAADNARKEKKIKQLQHWLTPIHIGSKRLSTLQLSPDGNYVFYQLTKSPKDEHTDVPNYATESGYTKDLHARPVVGTPQPEFEAFIYSRQADTTYVISTEQIPGIRDIPEFMKHYPKKLKALQADPALREVHFSSPFWNPAGTKAIVEIKALDHKDRWLMALDFKTGKLSLLDRQQDEAWIAGPGIGYTYSSGNVGWIDDSHIYFQSERTGYSQLYSLNVNTAESEALTSGNYEVQTAQLAPDHQSFYLTANKLAPSEKQFYHLDIASKKMIQITEKSGGHRVTLSPDTKYIADLYSTSNQPWELYWQRAKSGTTPHQITDKATSEAFDAYDWRKPEIFTFTNRDGQQVYAEVYRPKQQAESKPGVIFVHGAGYLQDVKNWWSDAYFREHMFMNLLADKGYTVMNIDYRGSAGYGRDWRTAIYRHMGGNDLEDIVDGAHYMVENFDVNPDNLGLWGGSYGGFMTLSALFKTDVFACGAALRSVTDWAHYNHGYTSDILNLPQNDPEAYHRSSPINFAKGLNPDEALLMCHGMVDTNVHFQDVVRLSQKLIELGKDNWELAVYPVESHGFVEPSSWTDEYKRILKLFEMHLK